MLNLSNEIAELPDTNDWKHYFDNKTVELTNINSFLVTEHEKYQDVLSIFPPPEKIFSSFFYTPLQNIQVVILGQDPYHNPGEAMGLCFSVPKEKKIPPSLKNIYKELQQDFPDSFEIPTHGDLTTWSKQGVFLLNATLTVRENCPNSHQKIWKDFTSDIIKYISDNTNNTVFLLWGGFAKSKKHLINEEKHCILEANHPSPLSANRGGWFGCSHFSKTNDYLKNLGKKIINWQV
jgi:uracil-DNA glycosylase